MTEEMGWYSGIKLTTGAIADMEVSTTGEAIFALDNLLNMMVMQHFKEILRISDEGQNLDRAINILENEVRHVVENEVIDHKEFLDSLLGTLVMERCLFFISNLSKEQNVKG